MTSLQSSVAQMGEEVTQIIIFKGGVKKTIRHIQTASIEQGQYTKFKTTDGRMILVNDPNVLMIEVFKETP